MLLFWHVIPYLFIIYIIAMNSMLNSIGLIALAVALVIISVLFGGKMDQYLKNQAFADCAKIGNFQTVTQGSSGENQTFTTTSHEPIRSIYKICVQDKGYSTKLE